MKMLLRRLLLSLSFSLLLPASLAFPLCTDASQSVTLPTSDRRWRAACSTNLLLLLLFLPPGAPVLLNTTLKFCASPSGSGNSSCCDATADAALSKQFDAMAIADAACAAVVKSILCAVSIIHPYRRFACLGLMLWGWSAGQGFSSDGFANLLHPAASLTVIFTCTVLIYRNIETFAFPGTQLVTITRVLQKKC
jgi:hypothetical protein